jgi:hypothetical protein
MDLINKLLTGTSESQEWKRKKKENIINMEKQKRKIEEASSEYLSADVCVASMAAALVRPSNQKIFFF